MCSPERRHRAAVIRNPFGTILSGSDQKTSAQKSGGLFLSSSHARQCQVSGNTPSPTCRRCEESPADGWGRRSNLKAYPRPSRSEKSPLPSGRGIRSLVWEGKGDIPDIRWFRGPSLGMSPRDEVRVNLLPSTLRSKDRRAGWTLTPNPK